MPERKILVVDDEEIIRNVITQGLKQKNYEVLTASNIEEARTALENNEVDLILLDQFIGDSNGLDFLADLRFENNVTTPVIIITGFANPDVVQLAAKYGVSDFLVKPVNLERLRNAVDKIFSGDAPASTEGFEGKKALIISTSKPEIAKLVGMLNKLCIKYSATENWLDGVKLVQKTKPDVVLISSSLPEVDGATMIKRLQKAPAHRNRAFMLVQDSASESARIDNTVMRLSINAATPAALAETLGGFFNSREEAEPAAD